MVGNSVLATQHWISIYSTKNELPQVKKIIHLLENLLISPHFLFRLVSNLVCIQFLHIYHWISAYTVFLLLAIYCRKMWTFRYDSQIFLVFSHVFRQNLGTCLLYFSAVHVLHIMLHFILTKNQIWPLT